MSGSYVSFAARRLVAAFVVAVVVSAITFVMLHVLRPEAFFDPRPLPAELGDYLWVRSPGSTSASPASRRSGRWGS